MLVYQRVHKIHEDSIKTDQKLKLYKHPQKKYNLKKLQQHGLEAIEKFK